MLKNKVCLCTGAASGIGAACARLFVNQEAKVVLADVQRERGAALAEELGGKESAIFVPCDVSAEQQVAAAVAAAGDAFGGLDVMLNNAGIIGATGAIDTMDMAAFQRTLDINLKGAVHGIRHAARVMKAANAGGTIINMTSVAGLRAHYASAGYTTSKAALIALTELSAMEFAPWGIRCNAVAPGGTSTPMVASFALSDANAAEAEVDKVVESMSPLKGLVLRAEDIANAVLYLAGPHGRAVNGHTLVVDLGVSVGVSGEVPRMSAGKPELLEEAGKRSATTSGP